MCYHCRGSNMRLVVCIPFGSWLLSVAQRKYVFQCKMYKPPFFSLEISMEQKVNIHFFPDLVIRTAWMLSDRTQYFQSTGIHPYIMNNNAWYFQKAQQSDKYQNNTTEREWLTCQVEQKQWRLWDWSNGGPNLCQAVITRKGSKDPLQVTRSAERVRQEQISFFPSGYLLAFDELTVVLAG